jgi:predicted nucleic acid-binding protein
MIFLETSFLIALYIKKDKYHDKAVQIERKTRYKQKIINKTVIYEVLTALRKMKLEDEEVKKYYNNLISLIILDESPYQIEALSACLNNKVGYYDNLHHLTMTNNGIKEIASFDPDFDAFDDIERIH